MSTLGNTLQHELARHGYSAERIDSIYNETLARLKRKSRVDFIPGAVMNPVATKYFLKREVATSTRYETFFSCIMLMIAQVRENECDWRTISIDEIETLMPEVFDMLPPHLRDLDLLGTLGVQGPEHPAGDSSDDRSGRRRSRDEPNAGGAGNGPAGAWREGSQGQRDRHSRALRPRTGFGCESLHPVVEGPPCDATGHPAAVFLINIVAPCRVRRAGMSRWRPPQPKSSPYITADGLARLKAELKQLWKDRREVVAALSAAAAEGDRSENAEYIYRKKQLREMDRRIRYLGKRIDAVTPVADVPSDPDRVFFGARVTVEDADGSETRYRIVGADEIDSDNNWISVDSPLARGLLGKSVDDEVTIETPAGRRVVAIVEVGYGASESDS